MLLSSLGEKYIENVIHKPESRNFEHILWHLFRSDISKIIVKVFSSSSLLDTVVLLLDWNRNSPPLCLHVGW